MLNKTLTFGLGKLYGYDTAVDNIFTLSDEQRKIVYGEIRQGFYDFAKLCNVTASLWYASRVLNIDIKEMGFNKGYKPILEKTGIETHLNGYVINQVYGAVNSHFTGEHGKKLMGTGESSLPTHRADGSHPLCFHTQATNVIKIEDSFYIVYHLLADRWAKQNDLPPWVAFEIRFKKRDKTGALQLERLLSGEWEKGSGQLVRNKRSNGPRYLMHLVVKYEPEPYKTLTPGTIMGIDLGVTTPAAVHFRTDGNPAKWAVCIGNGRMMLNARGIVRGEIVRLLKGLKRKDSPLQGAARDAAMNRLRVLRKQERRIMKTASQKVAAQIADHAKRNGAGIWQMEKITGEIKEDKPWLARNWAPGMLIDAIRWQAQQNGAELRFLNPYKTSQRCSKCGHIAPENRPKGKKKASFFECVACGYTDHADKNAARNLSTEGIEQVIAEAVKVPNGTGGASQIL